MFLCYLAKLILFPRVLSRRLPLPLCFHPLSPPRAPAEARWVPPPPPFPPPPPGGGFGDRETEKRGFVVVVVVVVVVGVGLREKKPCMRSFGGQKQRALTGETTKKWGKC